jgi:hypothetical protein
MVEAVVRGGKPALERDVLGCDCRIAAKEVPEGEMVALLFGPGDAEMNMVGARPFGRLLEERVHEIERAEGEVRVAQVSQPCPVAIRGLKGRDGDLDVDDWLGRETFTSSSRVHRPPLSAYPGGHGEHSAEPNARRQWRKAECDEQANFPLGTDRTSPVPGPRTAYRRERADLTSIVRQRPRAASRTPRLVFANVALNMGVL